MNQFPLHGVSIFPFSCTKWEFNSIDIISTSVAKSVFCCAFPCLALPSNVQGPLQLSDLSLVCPDYQGLNRFNDLNIDDTLNYIKQYFNERCDEKKLAQTKATKHFIDLYYKFIRAVIDSGELNGDCPWSDPLHLEDEEIPIFDSRIVFSGLLPMPEIWVHASDTILNMSSNWYRADLGFWTGKELVLIEIQGGSHVGKINDIMRYRAINSHDDIKVIYLHDDEIFKLAPYDMIKILPESVWKYWSYGSAKINPLGDGSCY